MAIASWEARPVRPAAFAWTGPDWSLDIAAASRPARPWRDSDGHWLSGSRSNRLSAGEPDADQRRRASASAMQLAARPSMRRCARQRLAGVSSVARALISVLDARDATWGVFRSRAGTAPVPRRVSRANWWQALAWPWDLFAPSAASRCGSACAALRGLPAAAGVVAVEFAGGIAVRGQSLAAGEAAGCDGW